MGKLIVKTNRLNSVIQNLSLTEIRLVQLGIISVRENKQKLSVETPIFIPSSLYAETFNTTQKNAYLIMKEAEKKLFRREFSFLDDDNDIVKSHWISQTKYKETEGGIEILFTPAVIKGITRIDGINEFFTKYLLEQTAQMNSNYSVRLYELLIQWRSKGKTPLFELEIFRKQLGLEPNQYNLMHNFKKRVLETSIKEINEKSDIKASYKQIKRGKKIIGFEFTIIEKVIKTVDKNNPLEKWKTKGLTDRQIRKLAVHKKDFIDSNPSKINSNDSRGYSEIFESWKPMLKDPQQVITFNKIQELLDRNN